MDNESLSPLSENSQFFCENLESERNTFKQDNDQFVKSDQILQKDDHIIGAQLNQSISEKKSAQKQPQSLEKSKLKVERSVFHNFQKHLVITLRQVIKIKKSLAKKQPQTVGWQIWETFLKQTRIYTKNILHIVFGVIDYEGSDISNLYDEKMIKRFGFFEIFAQNSQSLIEEAQSFLRSEAIRQLKKLNLKQFMKTRRVQHSQEFIEYVKQFISELEQGPIRKRLPKNKKSEMKIRRNIHTK